MRAYRIAELVVLPLAWGGTILAALQTQRLIGPTTHSICGPWGCGPETGALVAMHLGWMAILGPPLLYLPLRMRLSPRCVGRLAAGLVAVAAAGIGAIVAWQWLAWLPSAGAWARPYIWQRCAFAVVTAIDLPLLQVLGLGMILAVLNRKSLRRGNFAGAARFLPSQPHGSDANVATAKATEETASPALD
ncbi:MAG: hypothetical protein D6753_03630 [Planctomycetota bacterium]|nr:MAG: hypothetical protein D6753_03630 [Planctomycetota bacterium]